MRKKNFVRWLEILAGGAWMPRGYAVGLPTWFMDPGFGEFGKFLNGRRDGDGMEDPRGFLVRTRGLLGVPDRLFRVFFSSTPLDIK